MISVPMARKMFGALSVGLVAADFRDHSPRLCRNRNSRAREDFVNAVFHKEAA